VVGLSSEEGAAMLEISSAAFRQRLTRARADMDAFLSAHCGLANPTNPCRCAKLLPAAMAGGLIDPERRQLDALPVRRADRLLLEIETVRTAAEIFRSLPVHGAGEDLASFVRAIIDTEEPS
jgi:hypothetical protein